jgi:hypothetical protein
VTTRAQIPELLVVSLDYVAMDLLEHVFAEEQLRGVKGVELCLGDFLVDDFEDRAADRGSLEECFDVVHVEQLGADQVSSLFAGNLAHQELEEADHKRPGLRLDVEVDALERDEGVVPKEVALVQVPQFFEACVSLSWTNCSTLM